MNYAVLDKSKPIITLATADSLRNSCVLNTERVILFEIRFAYFNILLIPKTIWLSPASCQINVNLDIMTVSRSFVLCYNN